jgi:hypothetical protein
MSEFSGVINNGLERGWSREEIRASLLNAGYSQKEIDAELNVVSGYSSPQIMPAQSQGSDTKPLNRYQTPNLQTKNKTGLIILIIALSLVLIVGVAFGIYFLI